MRIICKTSGYTVREYLAEEANAFKQTFTDERLTQYLPKRNEAEVEQLFRDILVEYTDGTGLNRWAVVGQDDEMIGFIMLKKEMDANRAELGYAINYAYHNRGIATAVAQAVVQYGLGVKDLDEIFAVTNHENIPSQRVLIKAGLMPNGTLERKGMELALFSIST